MSTWSERLCAVHGDVDADGQIVDRVLLERLRAAIGRHLSVEGIPRWIRAPFQQRQPDEMVDVLILALQEYRERHPA